MKKITLLFILLTAYLGYAQQVVVENFDGTAPTFAGFEGLSSASIEADPAVAGTRGNNLRLVSQVAGNPWQGAEITMQTYKMNLTSDKTAQIDVYSTQAFTLLAKVELGAPGPNSAASQSYTTPGQWQTLTFTFNQSLDGTGVANGEYSKIVFFPNWKADNTGFNPAANFTIYIDNITSEGTPITPVADPAPTTAAPTPPARPAADVISIYSGSYAAIPAINLDQGWCGANSITATTAGGNDVLAYNNQACQGIDFDLNRQNFTGITNLHVDLFIAAGTDLVGKVFNVKIVPDAGAESEFNIDINALAPAPVPGTWFSYDMPITISGPHSSIRQVGVTSNLNNVLWYDNFYFHKNTITLSTEDLEIAGLNVYPNPTKDSWTVKTKNIKMSSIEVFDILGKQVLSLKPETTETTINASQLKSGLYFAKISTANGSSSLKLVKQ
ncbi:T9SS type A sorting domain-containing protein [Yeosuana sp. AK3]